MIFDKCQKTENSIVSPVSMTRVCAVGLAGGFFLTFRLIE